MMTLCAPIKYNAMKSFTDHICSPAARARRTYRQPCKSSGHIPRVLLRVAGGRSLRKAPARQTQFKRQGATIPNHTHDSWRNGLSTYT
jgi:hypothetical protein